MIWDGNWYSTAGGSNKENWTAGAKILTIGI